MAQGKRKKAKKATPRRTPRRQTASARTSKAKPLPQGFLGAKVVGDKVVVQVAPIGRTRRTSVKARNGNGSQDRDFVQVLSKAFQRAAAQAAKLPSKTGTR